MNRANNPDPPVSIKPKIQQPTPQALPSRSGPGSVLVSPRQKGNPVLNHIRALPWEYSDIPADYVLGTTTCALFLSLKYHRLHPEYIYSRIRALAGKYNLRLVLTMVDIQNHEESLRELSKTSLINNVTIILCWSAQEAGRYLELYKTFEHAAPTSIRAYQSSGYSEKLVDFICAPRSINKTDAMGLVSNFGSIRAAVNARSENIGLIAGWGHKKVERWCTGVRDPFRIQRTAKRKLNREESTISVVESEHVEQRQQKSGIEVGSRMEEALQATVHEPRGREVNYLDVEGAPGLGHVKTHSWQPNQDEEEAMRESSLQYEKRSESENEKMRTSARDYTEQDQPSGGIVAALATLREQG